MSNLAGIESQRRQRKESCDESDRHPRGCGIRKCATHSEGDFAMLNANCDASTRTIEDWHQESNGLGHSTRPQCLLIACTDVVMDRALERIQRIQKVIVMRRAGNVVPIDADDLRDERSPVNYAVEHLGVREIVVCGHSMCSGISAGQYQTPHREPSTGMEQLLEQVRHRTARNDEARKHLIRQLDALTMYPSVKHAIGLGELQIHGLFYLAESGIFTRYEEPVDQFVPLGIHG
jgi:carbonic anhydrase